MTICVFGSVNMDLTAYVDVLPQAGVTSHALKHAMSLGGKGANQAVATQRLYRDNVRFAAAIGQDGFGEVVWDFLVEYGVSTSDLSVLPETQTGIALIHVDAASQNTITVIGGANMAWTDDGPDAQFFEGARVALFQLETPLPATLNAMRAARAAGAYVVLDPAPVPDADIGALLALSEIVTPNEFEAERLTGIAPVDEASAIRAAQELLKRGCDTVVLKRGSRGVVYACRCGRTGAIPAFKVEVTDTVAAGDCFNGGLAAALAEGQDLDDALIFASAAGALATTRPGAADAAPARDQVDALIAAGRPKYVEANQDRSHVKRS
jgi:ribokinase